MSIKLVERPESPYWQLRGTVRGIRVRESTGVVLKDRRRAEDIRTKREAEILEQSIHGRAATATFAEAFNSYRQTGGRHGTGGEARFLEPAVRHFGRRTLTKIGLAEIEAYALKAYPDASPATRNRQAFTPVVAVLRHAALRGMCPMPIVARPKQGEPVTRWLRRDEADRLIDAAGKHLQPLVVFLIYTGARIGEALWLDWQDVDLGRAHVTFPRTKNGEARGVPLHPRVVAALANLQHRKGEVFRKPNGKAYTRPKAKEDDPDHMDRSAGTRIAKAFSGAVERAGLGERVPHPDPKYAKEGATRLETDVTPHVCRHTFSTWHYAANRDLGALQRLGGWKSVKMVLRYAHVNVGELAHTIDRLPSKGGPDTESAQPECVTEKSA
jgi:integrase